MTYHRAVTFVCVALLISLGGCDDGERAAPAAGASASSNAHPTMPPGFLDAAPPAPTSDSLVLSGGTLMLDPPIPDSVLLIRQGQLQAWGRRGEVDVPDDSVGRDMRAKWLLPGILDESTGTPVAKALALDAPLDLLILDADPNTTEISADNVVGSIRGGQLSLPDPSPG